MRIGLASDHVEFEHRESLKAMVTRGHTVEDLPAERVGVLIFYAGVYKRDAR